MLVVEGARARARRSPRFRAGIPPSLNKPCKKLKVQRAILTSSACTSPIYGPITAGRRFYPDWPPDSLRIPMLSLGNTEPNFMEDKPRCRCNLHTLQPQLALRLLLVTRHFGTPFVTLPNGLVVWSIRLQYPLSVLSVLLSPCSCCSIFCEIQAETLPIPRVPICQLARALSIVL